MSTKKLQILGSLGDKIYKQNEAPTDAEEGALWLDMDEEGLSSGGGMSGADWNAAEGESGHVLNRTHYAEDVMNWLVENEEITISSSTTQVDWINYEMLEGCTSVRVIFDGVTYDCPVAWNIYSGDMEIETCFVVGKGLYDVGESEYPFGFSGYIGSSNCWFKADIGTHTVSFAKISEVVHKLDKKYIPDDVGGGTSINVTAEVGQTIIVKAVDENGKPTEWEAAEYPVGAKIYTKDEIEQMTYEEFVAEYNKHPIILRHSMSSNDLSADILLTKSGNSIGGTGFCRRNGENINVYIHESYSSEKLQCDIRGYMSASFTYPLSGEGVVYYENSCFSLRNAEDIITIPTAIVELPIEYLVDGATLPVSYDLFGDTLTTYNNNPHLVIQTTIDNEQINLSALYVSIDYQTYATTVKILSPTTNSIITLTFVLET